MLEAMSGLLGRRISILTPGPLQLKSTIQGALGKLCNCVESGEKYIDMFTGALCPLLITKRPHSNIKNEYQSLIAAEKLNFDSQQLTIVEQLQQLQDRLDGYEPPTAASTGFLDRVSTYVCVYIYVCSDYRKSFSPKTKFFLLKNPWAIVRAFY